jgi:succinate--hydroxymethylglutarate CoA-transferase
MLARGPLSGLRVLDLSRVLAGPYATMMLGDMGADVIKVERPVSGDDTRTWGPPFTKAGHESAYFLSVNRNKRSIAIDLKQGEGADLVKSLASKSDIVIDNFAPGDAEKLGLSRDKFLHDNPSLIWCSITGYGRDGPLAHRLGYAVLLEAHSGLMNCTGPRDGDPVKAGVAMTDILTGLHACTGILAAVYKRTMTGKGSLIDCSLLESQVSAMTNVASNWLIGNQESQRLGTDHPSIVPYGTVKTRDGRIAIAAGNDSQFVGLCRCLGITYNEKFKTNANRVVNRDACISAIEAVTSSKTTSEWIEIFEKVEDGKFAFAPVNNMQQVFSDPQVVHRKMILECEHTTAGKIRLPGYPIKFPQHDFFACTPPPVLGEHTVQVLKEVMVMDDRSIRDLIDKGVVYSNVVL